MTTQEKNKLNAKAEAVLMGMTQKVNSNEEAEYLMDYICKTLGYTHETMHTLTSGKEILDEAFKYCKEKDECKIKAVSLSVIMGMAMITLPMTTPEDEDDEFIEMNGEFNLLSEYGVFSYVANLDCPQCSELGYAFFSDKKGYISRIG